MIIAVNEKLRKVSLHDLRISGIRDEQEYRASVAQHEGWILEDVKIKEMDADQDPTIAFKATRADLDQMGHIVFEKQDTELEVVESLISGFTPKQRTALRWAKNNNIEILKLLVAFDLLPKEIEQTLPQI